MRRPRAIACGDLNNGGDLLLLLQNLEFDGPGAIVRRWIDLPQDIQQQVCDAGGRLVPGRRIVAFARQCLGRDLVIGGGQLVRDNTSLRSLAGLLLAAMAVRISGGRVMTRGLGVSRLTSRPRRMLWSRILGLADRVNVRDHASERNAARLVAPRHIVRTADMAFVETGAKQRLFARFVGAARQGMVIAPCIDSSEGRTLAGPGLDALVEAAQAAGLADAVTIACHDPRPEMDPMAGAVLIARYADKPVALAQANGLPDLAALYGRSALVLTNRLHAMIMAAHAGAPVIALDQPEGKLTMYAAELGVAVVAPDAALTPQQAQALVAGAVGYDRAAREAAMARVGREAARNLESDARARVIGAESLAV